MIRSLRKAAHIIGLYVNRCRITGNPDLMSSLPTTLANNQGRIVFCSAVTISGCLLICDGCTGGARKMYDIEALKTNLGTPATEIRP
jgi:hypothetical protein